MSIELRFFCLKLLDIRILDILNPSVLNIGIHHIFLMLAFSRWFLNFFIWLFKIFDTFLDLQRILFWQSKFTKLLRLCLWYARRAYHDWAWKYRTNRILVLKIDWVQVEISRINFLFWFIMFLFEIVRFFHGIPDSNYRIHFSHRAWIKLTPIQKGLI